MGRALNLLGRQFEQLTVTARATDADGKSLSRNGHALWEVECFCGNRERRATTAELVNNWAKSCYKCNRVNDPEFDNNWQPSQTHSYGGTPCWEWTGAKDRKGYGLFGRSGRAHRVAWERANDEPIPEGMCVCHRCDNPPCINPAHLFPDTIQGNNLDCVNKRRHARGTKSGAAKLSDSDIKQIRLDSRRAREIAAEYGVTDSHICAIKNGKKWRHVRSRPGTWTPLSR